MAVMQVLRPVPHILILVLCETESVSGLIECTGEDLRMAKDHLQAHMGDIETIMKIYNSAPTLNLIIL